MTNYDNVSFDNTKSEQFGFKFGLEDGNGDKIMKTVICSESQQQIWCKAVNATIHAKNKLVASSLDLNNIDLFERFLKNATSWNRDKIWHKIFDAKSDESLLPIILSLFYGLLPIHFEKEKESMCSSPTELNECVLDESFDKNEDTMLCARNVYLNNRLIASNKLFSNECIRQNNKENILFVNDDESEHEETIDIHMKMISHQRKMSESEISFISAFDGGHDIDDNEFVLHERQPSKSRNEFMIKGDGYHKKKPKRKSKRSKHRKSKQVNKKIHRAKTSIDQSSESE